MRLDFGYRRVATTACIRKHLENIYDCFNCNRSVIVGIYNTGTYIYAASWVVLACQTQVVACWKSFILCSIVDESS